MKNLDNELDFIIQTCACANIRKAARIVTQVYEKQMASTGLKITQYYMLVNIARHREISISKLGDIMLLDQSTITRNVNILKKDGYVNITRDKNDSRTKFVSITEMGLSKIKEATPIWLELQEKAEHELGKETYNDLLEKLQRLQQSME